MVATSAIVEAASRLRRLTSVLPQWRSTHVRSIWIARGLMEISPGCCLSVVWLRGIDPPRRRPKEQ